MKIITSTLYPWMFEDHINPPDGKIPDEVKGVLVNAESVKIDPIGEWLRSSPDSDAHLYFFPHGANWFIDVQRVDYIDWLLRFPVFRDCGTAWYSSAGTMEVSVGNLDMVFDDATCERLLAMPLQA